VAEIEEAWRRRSVGAMFIECYNVERRASDVAAHKDRRYVAGDRRFIHVFNERGEVLTPMRDWVDDYVGATAGEKQSA
jgi:hypothetical protein